MMITDYQGAAQNMAGDKSRTAAGWWSQANVGVSRGPITLQMVTSRGSRGWCHTAWLPGTEGSQAGHPTGRMMEQVTGQCQAKAKCQVGLWRCEHKLGLQG